jgi:S-adenosylmethionine/arginine decarboxylase-like enzyme
VNSLEEKIKILEELRDIPPAYSHDLAVHLYGCMANVRSEERCRDFLGKAVEALGMRRQSNIVVVETPDEMMKANSDLGGLNGWVSFIESHIALETVFMQDYVKIMVSSCKPYDAKPVLELASKTFNPGTIEEAFAPSGLHYGKFQQEKLLIKWYADKGSSKAPGICL